MPSCPLFYYCSMGKYIVTFSETLMSSFQRFRSSYKPSFIRFQSTEVNTFSQFVGNLWPVRNLDIFNNVDDEWYCVFTDL